MLPVLPSSPSPKINSLSYSKFSYVHRVSKVFAFRRLVPSLQNTPVFEKEKKKKDFRFNSQCAKELSTPAKVLYKME